MDYSLGIDLGTTYSAAATARGDRLEIFQLGERAATIPSVIVLRADGEVLVGEAAERRAMSEPLRTAREFKRRLGDPTPIILGGTPYGAEALIGHLLRSIVAKVTEQLGGPPAAIALCHPASYGEYKIDLLRQAVRQSDIGQVEFIAEPQAAALHYALQERVPTGEVIAVYDFGGGTFDATILRKTEDGFDQLGRPEGMERLGGIDFDEAIFAHVMATVRAAGVTLDPNDPATLAGVARLREECRRAKEGLSTDTDATIAVYLPGIQTDVRLTREEFESMIRPRIRETIAALRTGGAERGPGLRRHRPDPARRRQLADPARRRDGPGGDPPTDRPRRPPEAHDGARRRMGRPAQPTARGRGSGRDGPGGRCRAGGRRSGPGGRRSRVRVGGGRRHGRTTGGRGRPGSRRRRPARFRPRRPVPPIRRPSPSGPRPPPFRSRPVRSDRDLPWLRRPAPGERARPLGVHRGWSSPPSPGSPSWSSPRGPSRSCRAARAAARRPARARSVPVGHLSRWRRRSPARVPRRARASPLRSAPSIAASPTPAPTPTPTPAGKQARINSIEVSGGRYVVDYEVFGYTQKLPGMHVHFFFDTVPPTKAGMPAKGPWYVYAGPIPFKGYKVSDRPTKATQMCILVANPDHSVIQKTGNCVDLPN